MNKTASGKSIKFILAQINEEIDDKKRYKITLKEVNDRNLDQNALSHAIYQDVASYFGDRTALDVKCESKLMVGCPIMKTECEDFRLQLAVLSKGKFTYEDKLLIMRNYPVTSIMSVKQMAQYVTDLHYYWRMQGVIFLASEYE